MRKIPKHRAAKEQTPFVDENVQSPALREQALAIPGKVSGCIPRKSEDAAKLYSLFHQLKEKLS